MRQLAACVCAAAGGGGWGKDHDGWQAASMCAAVSSRWGMCVTAFCSGGVRVTACSGGGMCAAAGGSGRQHGCNGWPAGGTIAMWQQRWRKGWQDGRKIAMNNGDGDGQLWVKVGVEGRSG